MLLLGMWSRGSIGRREVLELGLERNTACASEPDGCLMS